MPRFLVRRAALVRLALRCAAGFASGALLGLPAHAQAPKPTGQIMATAAVGYPFIAQGVANLQFGMVFPGVPTTVGVADPNAGVFQLTGLGNAQIQLVWSAPMVLARGAATMPIGNWQACYYATRTASACTPLSWNSTTAVRMGGAPFTLGTLFVWAGATVSPTANQPPGLYTGTVQLTALFIGL